MKIRVLDGLRGYAALMIVIAHLPQISDSRLGDILIAGSTFSKIGYLGVDIFFVLSGFLITRILIKEKSENRYSFKIFYLKRALRIFPIYYLTIIICGFLFSWDGMGYTAAYLSNYYFAVDGAPNPLRHTWSLAVEEHFYLVWPLLIFLFTLKSMKKLILYVLPVFVLLALIFTYQYFDLELANNLVYRGTQFRLLSLAIGSLFAFVEPKISNLNNRWTFGVFGIFISAYLLGLFVSRTILVDVIPEPSLLFIIFTVCSSSFFLLILQFENRKNFINSIFVNNPIRFIGKISYGIYLYHFPILYYFGITPNQLNGNFVQLIDIVVPLLLAFIIPVISFYIIEKPFLKLKGSLTNYLGDKPKFILQIEKKIIVNARECLAFDRKCDLFEVCRNKDLLNPCPNVI